MQKCTICPEKECLPDIIECQNLVQWNEYMDYLYDNVFTPDFLQSSPIFDGWKVFIRKEPKDGDREHGFTHMTHENYNHNTDPNDRIPDPRRSERLNLVKPIIERFECAKENNCGEIWYWEEMFRGRVRCNLLFEREKFLIVLERARDVYFIITSFYLEEEWALAKRKKKYEQYKKQKTPLV